MRIRLVLQLATIFPAFLLAEETSVNHFDANNRIAPAASTQSPLETIARDKNALDLQACFQLAAVRSDTLQINEQSIRAAQARLSQAIAQLFPTFNLVNTQSFQDNSPLASSIGSSGSFSAAGNRIYTSGTQLSFSQPIFNGFANYNNVGAERADVAAQRYNLQRGYQTLYASVAQAFYQILTNEGDLLILRESVHTLESQVEVLEGWVKIGRSRPSELLQSKAQLAATRVTVEQTKGLLGAAKELLSFYVGLPSDIIKLRESQPAPSAEALENYLRAVGSRPDILALVEQERTARRNLSSAKGALMPQVTANAAYQLAQDPGQPRKWTASLQIQLPLFDGGLIISRINEQKALTRQSELNVENLRRSADQDVRTAVSNFDSTAAQFVRLKEQVELAALNYNAQADDYKSGIVTNLDVLTALTTLQEARRSLNDADLNARLNLINLHVAAGLAATTISSPTPAAKSVPTPAPTRVP